MKRIDKFLYDIKLDKRIVGDSGDMEFDTEEEARADANKFIRDELSKEYNRKIIDFKILLYKAFI